jgi:regulator-associated protein of mTOR
MDSNPLLLVGAQDGVVRVWRDFTGLPACGGRQPALAAAWRALPGGLPTRRAPLAPAAYAYQQEAGCLFVAGEGAGGGCGHGLHVWDLARELCADLLPLSTLAADAHVTCLSAASGSLLLAGASDGRVLSFDLRSPAKLISSCRIHTTSVRGVLLQTGGHPNSVVTGGAGGDIIWSDLRNLIEPLSIVEAHKVRVRGLLPGMWGALLIPL